MKFLIIINVILFLLVLYLTILLIEPFEKSEDKVLQTQKTLRLTDIIPFYTEIDSVKLKFISNDYQNSVVWHNKPGEDYVKDRSYINTLYSIFFDCKKSRYSFDQFGFCEGSYEITIYSDTTYNFTYRSYDYLIYKNNNNTLYFKTSSTYLYFQILRRQLSCKYK